MFEIHASAKKNFDQKARSLIERIQEYPRANSPEPRFKSEVHVGATITDKEIIGELREAVNDYQGNTTGRFFTQDQKRFGLLDDGHIELVQLSEKIQRLPTFRDKISNNFVEERLFSWLTQAYQEATEHESSFVEYLVENAASAIEQMTMYVPVANTVLERPFKFCGAVVCNITKSLVDEMAKTGESIQDEEQRASSEAFFNQFRKDYQGYAAIKLNLNCEPEYANEVAVVTAQRITSFLGIYSGAVLMPDVKCTSRIKGTENLAQSTTIAVGKENSLRINSRILDSASARHWHISTNDLDEFAKCGLGIISELSCKERPTEFESLLLNTSILYSKAAFTSEPLDKLVYMLSALECTLLKSESEPIQQNLAERLAIFTSQELTERKAIIKCVKASYGFRSRYLHHGHSSGDIEQLKDFFVRVWVFYVQLLSNHQKFCSKEEFLEALDDHKLG
jgi:hypothetical protein